jgi:alpha,alpha-trehalose phosphorylase
VSTWALCETGVDVDALNRAESLFALGNGHVGVRGTLDEGDPVGLAGTYLSGFHETRELPYAESAYGNPEEGEVVVPVHDGSLVRLLVDDELFDVRYGELLAHERVLDLRTGTLERSAHWRSPAGREVRVRSTRLVSFTQRAILAIRYEVEAVGAPVRVVVQSELAADSDVAHLSDDPRAAAHVDHPLVAEEHHADESMVLLVHRARRSGLRAAAAADHDLGGDVDIGPVAGRLTIADDLGAGQTLCLVKYVAYAWSGQRSVASLRAQVRGSLAEARHTGWDGLLAQQREYLDDFWARADVELDGDDELQLAVRYGLFGVLQAGARAERRAIGAKGLTGTGYDGHAFWDTEAYVLPVLTYTAPEAAADALRWRASTLDDARARAQQLTLAGAAFPWRTIAGRECSGYWPAGTAAFHVNAAIAGAAMRQWRATGDERFRDEVAAPLVMETARLWLALGHHDEEGAFHIPGVTGPDEYSALADDNVYTNLMAAANLRAAVELGCGDEPERRAWTAAADAMTIPFSAAAGVHEQAAGFLSHDVWDFEGTRPEQYPLLLHFPYFDLYRKQVVKQADLVMALWTRGDAFSAEEKARAFAVYEPLTVRDSSLSACVQAIVAAETGHLQLAYDYLGEAALMDLHDLEHNTGDGLHGASLAGGWLALVAGFGGFRDHGGKLAFAPRAAPHVSRLCFRLFVRGTTLVVTIADGQATYAGEGLTVFHEGEELTLGADPVARPLAQLEPPPAVKQPARRAPRRRA